MKWEGEELEENLKEFIDVEYNIGEKKSGRNK